MMTEREERERGEGERGTERAVNERTREGGGGRRFSRESDQGTLALLHMPASTKAIFTAFGRHT